MPFRTDEALTLESLPAFWPLWPHAYQQGRAHCVFCGMLESHPLHEPQEPTVTQTVTPAKN